MDIPLPPTPPQARYSPSHITSPQSDEDDDDIPVPPPPKPTPPPAPKEKKPMPTSSSTPNYPGPRGGGGGSVLGRDKAKQRLKAFAIAKAGPVSFGINKLKKVTAASTFNNDDDEERGGGGVETLTAAAVTASAAAMTASASEVGRVSKPPPKKSNIESIIGEERKESALKALATPNLHANRIPIPVVEKPSNSPSQATGVDNMGFLTSGVRRESAKKNVEERRSRRSGSRGKRSRSRERKRRSRSRESRRRRSSPEMPSLRRMGMEFDKLPDSWKGFKEQDVDITCSRYSRLVSRAAEDGKTAIPESPDAANLPLSEQLMTSPAKTRKRCFLAVRGAENEGSRLLDPTTYLCEKAFSKDRLYNPNNDLQVYYRYSEFPRKLIRETKAKPVIEYSLNKCSESAYYDSREKVLSNEADDVKKVMNSILSAEAPEAGGEDLVDSERGWFAVAEEFMEGGAVKQVKRAVEETEETKKAVETVKQPPKEDLKEELSEKYDDFMQSLEDDAVAAKPKEKTKKKEEGEEGGKKKKKKKEKKSKKKAEGEKKKKKSKKTVNEEEKENEGDVVKPKKKKKKKVVPDEPMEVEEEQQKEEEALPVKSKKAKKKKKKKKKKHKKAIEEEEEDAGSPIMDEDRQRNPSGGLANIGTWEDPMKLTDLRSVDLEPSSEGDRRTPSPPRKSATPIAASFANKLMNMAGYNTEKEEGSRKRRVSSSEGPSPKRPLRDQSPPPRAERVRYESERSRSSRGSPPPPRRETPPPRGRAGPRTPSPPPRRGPGPRTPSPRRPSDEFPRQRSPPWRPSSPPPGDRSPGGRRSPLRRRTPPLRSSPRRGSPTPPPRRRSPSPRTRRTPSPRGRGRSPSPPRRRTPSPRGRGPRSPSPRGRGAPRSPSPRSRPFRRSPSPRGRRRSLSPPRHYRTGSPRRRTPSPRSRRSPPSPRGGYRRSPSPRRWRGSPSADFHPRRRSPSPYSYRGRSPSPYHRARRTPSPRSAGGRYTPPPRRRSPTGRYDSPSSYHLERSVADSTISDADLIASHRSVPSFISAPPAEPPPQFPPSAPPGSAPSSGGVNSPKRLSLDERLELEHGIKMKDAVHVDYSRPPPGYLPSGLPAGLPAHLPPRVPPPVSADPPEEGRLVRVGNMLQIVPDETKRPIVAPPVAVAPPVVNPVPPVPPPKVALPPKITPPAKVTPPPTKKAPVVVNTLKQKMEAMKKQEELKLKQKREQKVAERLQQIVEQEPKGSKDAPAAPAKRILETIEKEEDLEAKEARLLQEAISSVPELDSDGVAGTSEENGERRKKSKKNEVRYISLKPFSKKERRRQKMLMMNPEPEEEEEEEEFVPRSPVPLPDNDTCKPILVQFGFGISERGPTKKVKTNKKVLRYADGVLPGQGSPDRDDESPPLATPTEPRKKRKKLRLRVIQEAPGPDESSPPPPPPGSPPRRHYKEFIEAYSRLIVQVGN